MKHISVIYNTKR